MYGSTYVESARFIKGNMPTIKQKRAFNKVVENGGNVSQAMLAADYSPATAKTPQKLTESDGWKELMDQHLPDKLLAKVHKEGLHATTKKPHLVDRDDKGRPVYEYIPEDDYSTRHRYLETAYKLKAKYPEEKQPAQLNQFNFFNLSKDELEREIATTVAEIKAIEAGTSIPASQE